MRQWAARPCKHTNQDSALCKLNSSQNKVACGGQGWEVFSRTQQPLGVKGALCAGREARRASKRAVALSTWLSRNLWSFMPRCPPGGWRFLSLTLSVYLCVTNICFYVFLGPLSFVFSINTSCSGEDKQGHNHAIK